MTLMCAIVHVGFLCIKVNFKEGQSNDLQFYLFLALSIVHISHLLVQFLFTSLLHRIVLINNSSLNFCFSTYLMIG